MDDSDYYYPDGYDYSDETTVSVNVDVTSSTTTISSTSTLASPTTLQADDTPVAEVSPWGGKESPSPETSPESTAEKFGGADPFGNNPFGKPEFLPGFGSKPEKFKNLVSPEVEPEPEGEWRLATRLVDGTCIWEQNPWGEPEPESEPAGEPEYAYAEPPAPLLQASRYRERGTYSTLAAVVATLIIVLNIAVLVVLARRPKQRKTLSYLLGLIAAFDILGGIQFLWFSSFDVNLMFTHANMWIIVMCGIWMLSMAPQISAMLHFGLHLWNELNVGVNNAKVSPGRILFVVLTVFALPIALFIPPLAGWNCIGCQSPADDLDYCAKRCSMAIFPFTKIYVLLMVVLLFAAMSLVVSIYATIYWTICLKKCQRQLSPKSGKSDVIRVTTLLLVVYILCVLPVSIVMIFDYVSVKCNPQLINAFHATLFVSFLSNMVNPIIVFSTLPSMRSMSRIKADSNKLSNGSKCDSARVGVNNGFDGPYVCDTKPPGVHNSPSDSDAQEVTKI